MSDEIKPANTREITERLEQSISARIVVSRRFGVVAEEFVEAVDHSLSNGTRHLLLGALGYDERSGPIHGK